MAPLSSTRAIHDLIPQVPGTAEMSTPFGEGAKGWGQRVGQPAASGLWQIEAASIGLVWRGAEYNVYEPLSPTLEECIANTVPKGANVAALVAAWLPYNPGWMPGHGVVIPNTEHAPIFGS